jgi:hypothetical protein
MDTFAKEKYNKINVHKATPLVILTTLRYQGIFEQVFSPLTIKALDKVLTLSLLKKVYKDINVDFCSLTIKALDKVLTLYLLEQVYIHITVDFHLASP